MLTLSNLSDPVIRLFNLIVDQPDKSHPGSLVILITVLLVFICGSPLPAQIINQPYYCELRGSIYIEEYPDPADFLVYEEDSEAFADLLVFETDNSLFADKPGIWYFTNDRAFADFTIYFVESKNNADFTVYFTAFESFAGCNN